MACNYLNQHDHLADKYDLVVLYYNFKYKLYKFINYLNSNVKQNIYLTNSIAYCLRYPKATFSLNDDI